MWIRQEKVLNVPILFESGVLAKNVSVKTCTDVFQWNVVNTIGIIFWS